MSITLDIQPYCQKCNNFDVIQTRFNHIDSEPCYVLECSHARECAIALQEGYKKCGSCEYFKRAHEKFTKKEHKNE